jgi:hypothetical protein
MRLTKLVLILSLCISAPVKAQNEMSLVAHQDLGLSFENSWTVRLSGSSLTVDRPSKKPQTRRLTEKELDQLRQALKESNWGALNSVYGCPRSCDDFPRCSIDATSGGVSNRVVIYQAEKPTPVSKEVGRFLSVWKVVKALAGLVGVKDACP